MFSTSRLAVKNSRPSIDPFAAMLPKEAHGYRARESVMHVLWEMDQCLEKYVKNAAKR